MTGVLVSSLVSPVRRAALPLATYYTVTLVLPLANGAAGADPTFMRHALVVLFVPAALVMLMCAARILFQGAGVFVVTLLSRCEHVPAGLPRRTRRTRRTNSAKAPQSQPASGSAPIGA